MPRIRRVDRSSYEVGQIVWRGSGITPPNTLLCDGSAVSRTVYSKLFSKISTTFGSGNGTTTFNLPDFRSRMPIGSGQGLGLSTRVVGQVFGAESVAIDVSHLPAHNHSGTTTPYANDHQHTYRFPNGARFSNAFTAVASSTAGASTGGGGSHAHGVTAQDPSGSTSTVDHNNLSPFLALNFFIAFR